jgi:hypothetical protein
VDIYPPLVAVAMEVAHLLSGEARNMAELAYNRVLKMNPPRRRPIPPRVPGPQRRTVSFQEAPIDLISESEMHVCARGPALGARGRKPNWTEARSWAEEGEAGGDDARRRAQAGVQHDLEDVLPAEAEQHCEKY